MNKQHPNIKFIFKVKQNKSFSFLVIKIYNENNKFHYFISYKTYTFIILH